MSNSASFSYAQAAKGQSAAQSVGSQSSAAPSQAPSTTSTQSRDVAPTPSTRAPSVAISTTSNDGSQNTRSSSVKPESVSLNGNDSDSVSTSDKAVELSSLANQSTEKVLSEVVPQSTERRGRGQTLTSQATDVSDSKKPRKGKKSRTAEKESERDQDQEKKENVPLKVELSEAPVPAVNVWAQRQEAWAAKVKAASPTTAQPHSSNSANGNQLDGSSIASTQDQKQRAIQGDGADATAAQNRPLSGGAKPPKKDAEQLRSNGNQNNRRTAPRGSRMNNGEDKASVETFGPIANNTLSWPTPETAANGLKTQAQAGKPEKEQKEETGPSKPRQKKEWTPIEFVPTVNFETPMPTRGSRGGRAGGSRGGRDAGGRSNHASNASTGNPLHASSALKSTNYRKDRTHENGATSGATSVAPPASKRASVDISTTRDSRKPQGQAGLAKVSGDASSVSGVILKPTKSARINLKQQTSSKADTSKQNPADSANGIPGQNIPVRAAGSSQRTDDSKSSQPSRDNGLQGTKDSGFQGQSNANRSERSRGGARGRGGHSVNGATHPQSQFGQGPAYSYPTNTNQRQPAHPYAMGYAPMPYGGAFPVQTTASQHRSRPSSGSNRPQTNGRHQSSRTSSYPLPGMPYDPTMFSHGSGAYSPYTDPNHLLSGVLSQVEYYFSIDNLCKDWYLRKFMDSQGFVPLDVIASFKRMQEIAADWQLIRIACDSSPLIEYIVTEDGQDKVRRREQWEPWVLAMHMRHPTAQHDGPANYHPFNGQMFWPQILPYGAGAAPMFSPTGTESHFPQYVNGNSVTSPSINGTNGHVRPSESQLSATVPEFSPTGNPGMGSASQQGTVSSDTPSNDFKADISDKKATISSFSEHVSSLPNGSHKPDITEPLVNGINGHHETEGY
ncbi:hypothetical protein K449DRAFT_426324 [Hypoxylon sp. EC38]|nr:hypothetical protein K449DRAFT_426324 [Hypoxylon sp. EC38]